MAEQFGVIGSDEERGPIHEAAEVLDLFDACVEKVGSVIVGGLERERAVVGSFRLIAAGDGVVFDACEAAMVGGGEVRCDVIEIQVESDVTIEVAIARIAGVTFVSAPDLTCGFEVAAEGGDAVWGEDGCEDAVAGARRGVEEAVGIEDEPAEVGLLEGEFEAIGVGTFGEPDAAGFASEPELVMIFSGEDLGLDGRGMASEEGEERVCGSAGNDFELGVVLEFAEGGDEVMVAGGPGVVEVGEALEVIGGEVMEVRVPSGAVGFFFGEVDEFIEVYMVALLEERIEEHGAESGGESEGERGADLIAEPALEDVDEGEVGFGDGLEQPAFFEETFVFRVANEREVRVEHQGEVARHGCQSE
jgi:hypothetical protein